MAEKYFQHDHSQSNKESVVPVASLFTPVSGRGGTNNTGGRSSIAPATGGPMFRDYEKPARRKKDNPDLVLCSTDGCSAFPMSRSPQGLCIAHSRSMGEYEKLQEVIEDADTDTE